MRRIANIVALLLMNALPVLAENCGPRPAFQSLRFEEDWRFLADPDCATAPLDRWKHLKLGDRPGQYFTLGADVRLRYERFENPAFGAEVDDRDGYWLQRYLAHADYHHDDALRAFVQLQSSLVHGRRAGPRATDRDDLDVEQAFVDWTLGSTRDNFLTFRLGRQEIEFGSARLVTARDSLNDRLSFDGARFQGRHDGLRYGGWFTRPVLTRAGVLDDGTDHTQTVSGAYVAFSHEKFQGGNVAIGYVGRRRDTVTYDQGRGAEDRHTTLIRSWARGEAWDHNWEVGGQFGDFADASIRAWYVATDTGYTRASLPLAPRFGLRADASSGDGNLGDAALGTFNPLFAATAFSGLAGLIGPSNTYDIAPSVTVRLHEDLSVTAGAIVFWRQRTADGVYAIAGNPIRTGRRSTARHIGDQYTLQLNWSIDRHTAVLATLAYFDAGRFLQETPPGEDVTYFTTWLNWRF